MYFYKFYIKFVKENLNKKSNILIMDIVKFKSEVETLKKFFEIYCVNKHKNQEKISTILNYKNEEVIIELNLCKECNKKINYSFGRLLECPHEEKPRCRTCPSPCYEKKQWKEVAGIMRYSGMSLGLTHINKKFKSIFKKQ